MKLRLVLRLALVSSLLWLSACSEQLFGHLAEHEANEVVSVLSAEGIEASKQPGPEATWVVLVDHDDFARAVALLKNQNLPSQDFDGLGSMFRKDSLVSTPTEERARLIYALSQELQRTLLQIDGVIIARVHPVILPMDSFSDKPRVASASVLIKHRSNVDLASYVPTIRALVTNGIEGVAIENVTVALFPAEVRSAAVAKPPSPWHTGRWFLLAIGLLLALLLAVSVSLQGRDRLRAAWLRARSAARASTTARHPT